MKRFTNELKSYLISTAVEGGSNYWYMFEQDACDNIRKHKGVEHPDNKYHTFSEAIFVALENGESIPVHDGESGELLGNLTKDSLDNAQDLLHDEYPNVYGHILAENYDNNDADIWFQLAVMGKVVFG